MYPFQHVLVPLSLIFKSLFIFNSHLFSLELHVLDYLSASVFRFLILLGDLQRGLLPVDLAHPLQLLDLARMLLSDLPHLPLVLLHQPLLIHLILTLHCLQLLLLLRVILHQRLLQLFLVLLCCLLQFLIDDRLVIGDGYKLVPELLGECGLDCVALLLHALSLLVLRGLNPRQLVTHERLVVLLQRRDVQRMLRLQLNQLPLTLQLSRLQTPIPLLLDRMHVVLDLLSLLLLLSLNLLDPFSFTVPLLLGFLGPRDHLHDLASDLLADPLDDLVLPPLHHLAVLVEPLEHLLALRLKQSLSLCQRLHLKPLRRHSRPLIAQLPPQPLDLLEPLRVLIREQVVLG